MIFVLQSPPEHVNSSGPDHNRPMEIRSLRQTIAANLATLYSAATYEYAARNDGAQLTLRRWAIGLELGLKPKAAEMLITRMLKGSNGGSAETIQKIADATGVAPWALLAPGMRPPIPDLSPRAAELALLFDSISDAAGQRRAYATALVVLTGEIPGSEN